MIGTVAERNLLGVIISQPSQLSVVRDRVSAEDFSDPRLGAIFDGITQMAATGQPIDGITVGNRFAEWGIRNLDAFSPTAWSVGEFLTYAAPEYAEAVRMDGVRRGIAEQSQLARDRIATGENPTLVAADMTRALASLVDGAVTGRMHPVSLGDILDCEDTEPDWVIEHLLERYDRLVITGPEGGGKSTLVRQLVILPAAGVHPMSFAPCEPITALVVDAENTERQWRRSATWMANRAREAGRRDPRQHVHIVAGRRIDITGGADLGQIHRMIDTIQPDIVYIGPLYKLVPHAINNDDDAAPLITALDSIRERGVGMIMEAHAGHGTKLGGERDLRPRGSSALLGWPEFGFGIQPVEDDMNTVSIVRWRGDREERMWPRVLQRGLSWPWEPIA